MAMAREKYDLQRMRAKQRGIVPGISKLALGESSLAVKTHYDEFLSKLFWNHPSQSRDRNRKPRPTALDMWDLNDEKKRWEGSRAISDTIMDADLSYEEKQVKLVEANPEPSDEEQRGHIEVEDDSNMCDDAIQNLFEPRQELEMGEAVQALIIEGKRHWTEVDAEVVSGRLPRLKRARSSTNSPEIEGTGQKKRREDLQKELDIIESLKRKIDSSEDIEPATVEKLESGKMSLEELEQISGQMEEANTPASS
jgi:hypothetical protein